MSAQVERDDTGWQWFCGDCGDWSTYYTFEDDALADAADHDGRWHVHYRADDVSFARLLTAMFSVGTALHLTERGIDRLARCAADDCRQVFADTTRNGRKAYCSPRCNNRSAVRRHRARV